jgi:hypothetical protein
MEISTSYERACLRKVQERKEEEKREINLFKV